MTTSMGWWQKLNDFSDKLNEEEAERKRLKVEQRKAKRAVKAEEKAKSQELKKAEQVEKQRIKDEAIEEKQTVTAEQKRLQSEAGKKAKEIKDREKQEQAIAAEEARRKDEAEQARLKYKRGLVAFESFIVHEFSTSGEKTKGQHLYILNDGGIRIGSVRRSKFKSAYELSNEQVVKIETSSSQAGVTTENTIKLTADDGRIDVFRPINFGPTFDRSMREASKLPAILSAVYGERYSRL